MNTSKKSAGEKFAIYLAYYSTYWLHRNSPAAPWLSAPIYQLPRLCNLTSHPTREPRPHCPPCHTPFDRDAGGRVSDRAGGLVAAGDPSRHQMTAPVEGGGASASGEVRQRRRTSGSILIASYNIRDDRRGGLHSAVRSLSRGRVDDKTSSLPKMAKTTAPPWPKNISPFLSDQAIARKFAS